MILSSIACSPERFAAESMVLLKNDGVLPFARSLKTIAVIGPNAACAVRD